MVLCAVIMIGIDINTVTVIPGLDITTLIPLHLKLGATKSLVVPILVPVAAVHFGSGVGHADSLTGLLGISNVALTTLYSIKRVSQFIANWYIS